MIDVSIILLIFMYVIFDTILFSSRERYVCSKLLQTQSATKSYHTFLKY